MVMSSKVAAKILEDEKEDSEKSRSSCISESSEN